MAHKCGFTLKVLIATLQTNGFTAKNGVTKNGVKESKERGQVLH
jgi:hypothetical protein